MAVCVSCGNANPDGAKFCLECGNPLAAAASAAEPAEERRVITAVFTDVVGSTAAAERLDPEDVRARLVAYYAHARGQLTRHGGTVEKFIGDAVVAVFGAPVAHEDDPERAVRAALAVHAAIAKLNADDEWLDLHLRTAVHTGEAIVVLGSAAAEGEGIAAGDVMNTAARLQSGAPVDGIVVGEATFRATRDVIEYREAEPVLAKGKGEPVPLWEVVGVKHVPPARTASRPLIGRTAELGVLMGAWRSALARQTPQLATVVGAPGIGKTRLLQALCERAERDGAAYWGRCLSYGEGITYWPITEIVKDAAGILHDDGTDVASAKLGALIESVDVDDGDELRTIAAAAANVVGVAATPRGTYAADDITQAELHWGIRRLLHLLASKCPLLLVFEDLHWAEPTLLDLVVELGDRDADGSLLVVGSGRPELLESGHALVARSEQRPLVELVPLTTAESEALLADLLGTRADRRVDALLEKAGGNPLFLEEIVRMLADRGLLDGAADFDDIAVPDSLQALIGARLDTLAGRDKRTAQHASVVGGVFWSGAVAHLEDRADVGPSLAALEERDFIRARDESSVAGEREYAFKHILIRDVAYERLPKGRRAALHVRFANWLERVTAAEDELPEILAYHLEQACRLGRAVARPPIELPVARAVAALIRSAERAERREGVREADRFYERGLELVSDDELQLATDLRLRRSRTLVALGDLRRAHDQLLGVAEDALMHEWNALRCQALLLLANIDKKQGRATEARPRLAEADSLAVELADKCLQIRASFELAHLRSWFEGDVERAAGELRHAIALAEQVDDRSLRIEGHMRLGSLVFNAGDLAEAEEQLQRATELAGEVGSFRDEARATSMLGFVKYYRGEREEAERLAVEALDWLERTCDTHLQLQNLRALAMYALARDDFELAEEHLRAAVPLAVEAGGWLLIETYRYLAEALVHQGKADEARTVLAFAARDVTTEDRYSRALLLMGDSVVATATGDDSTGAATFDEACRIMEEQQREVDVAEGRVAYARALAASGHSEEARAQLRRASVLFVRIGAAGPLAEIDRRLGELSEGAGERDPLASASEQRR